VADAVFWALVVLATLTLAFWLITLVSSVAIGFGVYRVFSTLLGIR